MKKFQISLKGAPKSIVREIDGNTVLVLEIPSLNGRKRFVLKDGDIVEAVDKVMEMSLQSYEYPKLPVYRKPKNGNKFSNMFYDVEKFRGKKPFSEVVE